MLDQNKRKPNHDSCSEECCSQHDVINIEIRHLQESLERVEADLHATQDKCDRLTSRLDISEGKALVWSLVGSATATFLMQILLDRLSHK